ncbi:hypothetical protein D5086_020633 [Populus alba]|uniref:Uncharacterized protein n=1 Tax=Populus alba TaxID=43335 RepID=A0ACC4BM26_POPAL
MELTGVSDAIDPVSSLLVSGEDGMRKKGGERRKRGRGRGRGSVTNAKAVVTMSSGMPLSGGKRTNDHIHMAIGRVDENEEQDPISFDSNNTLTDWVKGKELCSEDFDTLNWMAVDPPSDNASLLGTSHSEIEDLGAGFDDYEIFNRVKEGEEENVESM